ncbi:MAG: tetratricopeptide repeat protein [Deltaproteobacteria bacterium]|jgi:tetratricopeptide (TPR) repeat protein/GGDEF domain-containing protein|nr:tetratricopeptide repeat protein [Deltaproteobacteria bacterium]
MSAWPLLFARDLRRFDHDLQKALTRFLPDYEFQVGPTPEPGSDLAAPLAYQGRPLGYVSVSLKSGCHPAPPEVLALWPSLADSALENLALRKALQKDSESGLYNRRFFLGRLKKLLHDSPRAVEPNPTLTRETLDRSALIVALVGLSRGQPDLDRRVARLLFDRRILCLARLERDRLGLLLRAEPEEGRHFLEDFRLRVQKCLPRRQTSLGYALWPQDLPAHSTNKADVLLERAETALFFAAAPEAPVAVIGFGELVEKQGHLIQVLPQDRVILNLGRAMGAQAGQVFVVKSSTGEPKGEIAIFETADNYSLANVTSGGPHRLATGDQIFLTRQASLKSRRASSPDEEKNQERQEFVETLTSQALSGQELTAALISIDDWEMLETLAGPEAMARRLAQVKSATGNEPTLATAEWSPGTLAVAWPRPESEIPGIIERLRGNLDFAVSLGLASWPSPVLGAEEIMDAAKKALLEASMTGPAQTIWFGAQSLNISGDHLFEEGDLREALAEYRRGLSLEPKHLNLLNSLGVCHGRLGDHQAAIQSFDEVLKLDPENLMALFNKGCSLVLTGLLEEAALALSQAAALPGAGYEVLYQHGRLTLELGRLEQALPTLRQAASLKDRRGDIFRLLGQAELLSGEVDRALEALKKAVKHDPDDAQSLSSLGVLFLERNNDREVALSLFQRSVEIDPTNSLFRQRLGKLLFDQGDFVESKRHLKAAVDYGCRALEVHRHLEEAQTLEEEGQLAQTFRRDRAS